MTKLNKSMIDGDQRREKYNLTPPHSNKSISHSKRMNSSLEVEGGLSR